MFHRISVALATLHVLVLMGETGLHFEGALIDNDGFIHMDDVLP